MTVIRADGVKRYRASYVAWLATLWLALAASGALPGQGEGIEEYRLKAAFIYNFSQFIEWPAAAFAATDSPLSICVMGHDPFGESLLALQQRTYKMRQIVVSYPKTVAEARDCRILYVDNPPATPLGRDVGAVLGDAPVLTVSSSGDAMESGIGIGFVQQAGRVRWSLNLDATRRAQLKLSSKLIEISLSVVDSSGR